MLCKIGDYFRRTRKRSHSYQFTTFEFTEPRPWILLHPRGESGLRERESARVNPDDRQTGSAVFGEVHIKYGVGLMQKYKMGSTGSLWELF